MSALESRSPRAVGPTRVPLETAVLVAVILLLAPAGPVTRGGSIAMAATAFALVAPVLGLLLAVRARRLEASDARRRAAIRGLLIGLLATNEELLWRRLALCELLRWGAVAAWAASSVLFALGHRSRPGLHLVTGSVFGGVYLATGALGAAICAHWAYNLLVDQASRRRARRRDPIR